MNELTIYECDAIIRQTEAIAAQNEGEIPEEQLQALVEAQTTSIAKLGNLCGFMKHLEHGISLCQTEEERIARMRKVAENRLDSIKRYLLPYIQQQGRPVSIGTFKLSTRKSTAVMLADGFEHLDYCVTKTVITPDKMKIKKALQDGRDVPGAVLVERLSVQLK